MSGHVYVVIRKLVDPICSVQDQESAMVHTAREIWFVGDLSPIVSCAQKDIIFEK